MHARDRMFPLFAADEIVAEPLLTTPTNSRSMESAFANIDTRSLKDTRANTDSLSKKKTKPWSGAVNFFDDNNHITLYLTTKTREKMKGRTVLEDNKVELMKFLQNIYSITNKPDSPGLQWVDTLKSPKLTIADKLKSPELQSVDIPKSPRVTEISQEFLEVVSPGLISKQDLSVHETRLLGQLAVVAFRNTKDGDLILLPTFHRARKIWIARMPRQYKERNEL